MIKSSKSLSKTLIISVALATFLSTAIQVQSVQAATSKPSKAKGGVVTKQHTRLENQKAAVAVNAKILALPKLNKMTLANKAAVINANKAYKALTDTQKSLVKSSSKAALNAAVSKIVDLTKVEEVNTLIKALPKVNKITIADAASVNKAYAAFKSLTKDQKKMLTPSYSGKITAAINKIASLKGDSLKALIELNSGKKAFSNFAKAGVTGAIDENGALYFAQIAKDKIAKGSDLTVAEIQVIVNTVNINVSEAKALVTINAGTEVFADFTTAGITGAVEVNKVAYDSAIAEAKVAKGSDLTLTEVQAIVDTININVITTTALIVINAGTEVFADFATAGITGAVEENKVAYDSAIVDAKTIKGLDLTLEEVQAVVNTKNQTVVDFNAAQVVINQIAALDNTKETYATDVVAAKEAYEMLTDVQKALVKNYDILVNAVQPIV
jgi:hypothetical protein